MSDQYRLLFETSTNPIFISLPSGQFVDVNPAWLELFGYTRKAALQLCLSDLYANPGEYQQFIYRLQEEDTVKDFEAEFHTSDHKKLVCLVSAAVRRNKAGQVSGYHGVMRDLTKRKRMERKIRAYHQMLEQKVAERTAQLETQVKQLSAISFITQMVASTRDPQAALEIVAREMVNLFDAHSSGIALRSENKKELTVVVHYSRDNNAISTVGTIIPLAENPATREVIETGKTIVVHQPQMNYLTETSHEIQPERQTVCLMILPLLARGQVIGAIGVDTIESDRKFTTDELMLAEVVAAQLAGIIQNVKSVDADLQQAYGRLKELDKLKSSFIGIITHELRSPFVAADLSIQLLYRYLDRGMHSELLNQIKRLDQELIEGRRMIDSLISFASLMSKQGHLFLEATDIESLTRDAIRHLVQIMEARQIEISLDFAPELSAVYLDQQRISEAIHHLVHNAIKFNRRGGTVKVSCRAEASEIIFRVEDTGIGIPPEKLDTIWQAFAQTVDDVQRGVEGLGLGLALVKSAVEAHGGTISVKSTVDKGSIFEFRLPLRSDHKAQGT